jgi:hypothetical protein
MTGIQRCTAVLLLVASLLGALPAPARADQVLDPALALYQSPTYGYMLRWTADAWQVTNTSSEGGLDVLEMQNETTVVQLAAYEGFGGDPDQCLTDAAGRVQAQYGQAFAPARYDDGTTAEEHGDGYAYGAFLSGPGPDYVVQVECRTLLQDRAVLQLTSVMASADYATSGNDGMSLIDTVALPRGAYVTQPDTERQLDVQNSYSDLDTGMYLSLAVTGHTDTYADASLPPPARGARWVAVDVSLENSGDVSVDIDALAITAFDDLGVSVQPAYYAWTQATGAPDASVQALAPDQSLAATLVYEVEVDRELISVTCACSGSPAVPVTMGQIAPDPRGVFPPAPNIPCSPMNWDAPKIIPDRTGAERVTMTATWLYDQEGVQILVGVENSGTAPITIAPEDLWIVVDDGAPYRLDSLTWESESGNVADGPRELAAGERAVARLAFTTDERPFSGIQLYYLGPDDGQLHDVAWFCVGCGCGGGGRPKVVLAY